MFRGILLPSSGYLMDGNNGICGPVPGAVAQNDLYKQIMKKHYGQRSDAFGFWSEKEKWCFQEKS